MSEDLVELPGFPLALEGAPLYDVLTINGEPLTIGGDVLHIGIDVDGVHERLVQDLERFCGDSGSGGWQESLRRALLEGSSREHIQRVTQVHLSEHTAQISFVPAGKAIEYGVQVRRQRNGFPATFPIPFGGDSFSFESFMPLRVSSLEAVGEINRELVQKLRKAPQELDKLEPRQFEQLVAHLLEEMGYSVELTQPSKDGGVDVFARIWTPQGRFLAVIDCKKYRQDRRIDVGMVRALSGLQVQEDATHAAYATTSYATRDARQWVGKHGKGMLAIHDRERVMEWLDADRWTRNAAGILLPPG